MTLQCDLGPQFISEEFKNLCDRYHISVHYSSAANHKSCSHAEERQSDINNALRRILLGKQEGWLQALPQVILGLNSTAAAVTGNSAFELFYARRPRTAVNFYLPTNPVTVASEATLVRRAQNGMQLFEDSTQKRVESHRETDKYYKAEGTRIFEVNEPALLFSETCPKGRVAKLWPKYRKVIITEKLPRHTYRVKLADTQRELPHIVHVDRLKHVNKEPAPAVKNDVNTPTNGPATVEGQADSAEKTRQTPTAVNITAGKNSEQNDIRQQRTALEQLQSQKDGQAATAQWDEIERIVARRRNPRNRATYLYKVRWRGYDPTHDTWLPAKYITADAISEFRKTLQGRRVGRR
jgi:hypothetical protein